MKTRITLLTAALLFCGTAILLSKSPAPRWLIHEEISKLEFQVQILSDFAKLSPEMQNKTIQLKKDQITVLQKRLDDFPAESATQK